jgi:hypothetical protein
VRTAKRIVTPALKKKIGAIYERFNRELIRTEKLTPEARRLLGELTSLVQRTGLPRYEFIHADSHGILTPDGKFIAFGFFPDESPIVSTLTPHGGWTVEESPTRSLN